MAWSEHACLGRRARRKGIIFVGATARLWDDLSIQTASEPGSTKFVPPLRWGDSQTTKAGLWLGVNIRVQAAARAEWSFFAKELQPVFGMI